MVGGRSGVDFWVVGGRCVFAKSLAAACDKIEGDVSSPDPGFSITSHFTPRYSISQSQNYQKELCRITASAAITYQQLFFLARALPKLLARASVRRRRNRLESSSRAPLAKGIRALRTPNTKDTASQPSSTTSSNSRQHHSSHPHSKLPLLSNPSINILRRLFGR
jgi:hypothetical protein